MVKIDLTEADDGRTVPVKIGDRVVVTLPENATTGVRWVVPKTDDFKVLADDNRVGGGGIGAAGVRVLTFSPTRPGKLSLRMLRRQEWESEATADASFEVKLDAS